MSSHPFVSGPSCPRTYVVKTLGSTIPKSSPFWWVGFQPSIHTAGFNDIALLTLLMGPLKGSGMLCLSTITARRYSESCCPWREKLPVSEHDQLTSGNWWWTSVDLGVTGKPVNPINHRQHCHCRWQVYSIGFPTCFPGEAMLWVLCSYLPIYSPT